MQWREKFWDAMCGFYGVQSSKRSLSECANVRDYELKVGVDFFPIRRVLQSAVWREEGSLSGHKMIKILFFWEIKEFLP